ncbi:hypothetical protein Tco_0513432 [Tanacetum coccineum]
MIVESLKEEKMYVKFSNNVEVEQRGSYLDVEGIKWVMTDLGFSRKEHTICSILMQLEARFESMLVEKGRRMIACTIWERQMYDVVPWSRKKGVEAKNDSSIDSN